MKFKLTEVERTIAPSISFIGCNKTHLRFTFSADDDTQGVHDAEIVITFLENHSKAIEWLNAMIEHENVFINAEI